MYRIIRIQSSISSIRIVENAIDTASGELGISKENYGKILVSTLEAVNNAILHGNKSDPQKKVIILISFKNEELIIKISDEGMGFKPKEVPDPTIPQNREALNGRGVFLMNKLADKIKYSKKGNSVTMTFKNIKT
jgi:serine/threonine-protein kinase RsbW